MDNFLIDLAAEITVVFEALQVNLVCGCKMIIVIGSSPVVLRCKQSF